MIQRWKVDSSMILAINYDAAQEVMELELHSGAIWRFHHVPDILVEDMLRAESKGKFYNAWVRDLFDREVVRDHGGRPVWNDHKQASMAS